MRDTIVDGLATRTPVEAKVRDVKNLVDGVVLVTAEQMMRAMEVPLREQHVLTELPGARARRRCCNPARTAAIAWGWSWAGQQIARSAETGDRQRRAVRDGDQRWGALLKDAAAG
jgi:hypothetical protein